MLRSTLAAIVVGTVLCSSAARADWCDDPSGWGLRACDDTDSACPEMYEWPPYTPFPPSGSWHADFSAFEEAGQYLSNLDAMVDTGGFMKVMGLGESPGMDISTTAAATGVSFDGSGSMRVVRIAADAESPSLDKPVVLLVAGVHAHEWIPQETALGLVDWLVKSANGEFPWNKETDYAEVIEILSEVEIWVVVMASPAGRKWDDYGTNDGIPPSSRN